MAEAHVHTAVCVCGHTKFATRETRSRSIHRVMSVVRRKTCMNCGAKYYTAEIPVHVAQDLWNEE